MIYIISSALGFMGFLFNYPLLFQIGGWLGIYYCVFNLLEMQERKESLSTVIFYLIPLITGLLTFSIENMLIASIVVMAIGSVSQLIKSKTPKSELSKETSLIQNDVRTSDKEECAQRPTEIKIMKEESSTKKVLKIIGVVVLILFVVVSWFFGFFWIIFYILGFYTAIYFLSLLFKTTSIIDTIITIGGIILYVGYTVLGLFLLYLVLRHMFEKNFFIGLLLLIFGIPLAEILFYAFIAALGVPLLYFRNLLEEKLGEKANIFN